ncbi:MAG: hypothetical protein J6T15_01930 [Bacilli bacterium]|nr:hypothetical protein [Bacilli bacterium]
MKAAKLKLLTLPLLFAMCGCSDSESGLFFSCISVNTANSVFKEYEKFDGECTYKRDFKNETVVSVSTTTKSGTLVLKVLNADTSEEYYAGNLTEDFSFTVTVPSGKCSMHVEGKEHSGSFKFSWADKQ